MTVNAINLGHQVLYDGQILYIIIYILLYIIKNCFPMQIRFNPCLKVQLTPEIFFRLTYAPSCPEYLCEKIIEIDKIHAFLQPFEVQHS